MPVVFELAVEALLARYTPVRILMQLHVLPVAEFRSENFAGAARQWADELGLVIVNWLILERDEVF